MEDKSVNLGSFAKYVEITPTEIKDAYKRAFSISWLDSILDWLGRGVFRLTNLNYNQLNWDEVAEIIAIDQSDQMEWVYNENEKYTCDDFAFALMGALHRYKTTAAMPIFKTWITMIAGGHAVVSFYDGEQVFIVEPQTDEIMTIEEATDKYGSMTLNLLNG